MKVQVEQVGADQLASDLKRAPEAIRAAISSEAFNVGERAVRYIRAIYRSEPSKTSTAVRSGMLRNSYASKVDRAGTDVTLTVGAIKPTDEGQVPIQARVQEGFDFADNKVEKFIIKAKNGGWLTFPIREGGGLSKDNIVGWARVKQVILTPRPALEPTSPAIIAALEEAAGKAAADAL